VPERFVSLSAPSSDELSLLELADRLLNRGVVLSGEATISVAGVDLIYLGLNVVLTAAENLKRKPEGSAAAAPRDHDV
jgi:gas vesicle structural protein